jgi:hypothetical protein
MNTGLQVVLQPLSFQSPCGLAQQRGRPRVRRKRRIAREGKPLFAAVSIVALCEDASRPSLPPGSGVGRGASFPAPTSLSARIPQSP